MRRYDKRSGSSERAKRAGAQTRLHLAESLERRLLLSTVTWINTGGGSWNTPGNWSTGAIPQPGDDAVINQPGNVQVTLAGSASINSLTITSDSLTILSGALLVAGNVTNSGSIAVSAAGQLTAGGNYNESAGAMLSLPGGGPTTDSTSNLLTNSGFESPAITTSGTTSPSAWPHWGGSYLSNQYAYDGTQSLQAGGPNSGVLQTFTATPDEAYTLSAYAMTPASDPLTGSEGAFLQMIFYDAGGNQLSNYNPPNAITILTASSGAGGPLTGTVGSQGWNHFSTTAVAPANAASVNAVLESGAYNGSGPGGGSVYWDDAKFGPAALGPSKLVATSISNSGAITVGPTNTITANGGFNQTASGVLDIQLGGAPSSDEFGQVSAGGTASLAGTLKADLVYGYSPSATDEFTPILFGAASGGFTSYQLPVGSGYQFQGAVTFTNVVLSAAPTTPLTTTVNAFNPLHSVTTNLLGANLAWWDSALTTTQSQQMVQAAGLTTYRFPGGSSSDDYHFNVSNNFADSVAVTIPQFAKFIEAVGGSGLVTLDYGSGSPQEAAAELAYLQGSANDTTQIGTGIEWNDSTNQWQNVNWQTVGYWAALRSTAPLATDDGLNFLRINHPAAFTQVSYWEVGNEEYGSWEIDHHGTAGPGGVSTGAQHDPATYAAFAKQFAGFAAEVAAGASLPPVWIGIDSGDPTGGYNNWIANVLSAGLNIGFVPKFISDHSYMQGPGSESDSFLLNSTVSNPSSVLDWTTRFSDYHSILQQTLGSQASSVQVMATEFNSVYTNPGKQSTSLVNGLFIADSIGSLLDSGYTGGFVWDLRNGWDPNQNDSPALYGWRKGGDYGMVGDPGLNQPPSTGAYVAYPNYFAEQLLSTMLANGTYVVSAVGNYQDIHSYAVTQNNDHLDLLVINTNPAANLTDLFNIQGFQPSGQAQVWQYGEFQDTAQSQSSNGASSLANFTTTLTVSGSNFSYAFPPYSMTVIDLTPAPGVTLNGTAGSDNFTLSQNKDHQHIDWSNGPTAGQFQISATDGLTINGIDGSDILTLDYTNGNPLPGAVHLNGTFIVNGLQGTNPLAATTLEIGRSTVYISYSTTDPLAAIQGYLKSGYNNGARNGTPSASTGVITSIPAAQNAAQTTAIGYCDSADGLIAGQPANTIELKYTLYGDTGLSGSVGFNDFTRLTQHYNQTSSGTWDTGDFNYDESVNFSDFTLVTRTYNVSLGSQASPAALPAASSVPPTMPAVFAAKPAKPKVQAKPATKPATQQRNASKHTKRRR